MKSLEQKALEDTRQVMKGKLFVAAWKRTPPDWANEVPQRPWAQRQAMQAPPLDYEVPPFYLP